MKKTLLIIILLTVVGVVLLGQGKSGHQITVQVQTVAPPIPAQHAPLQTHLSRGAGPVERLSQLARDQYHSQADYDAYAYSACSAAAMAESMNAYGLHLRVADVLKVEIALHEITPELGMLNGVQSIARTVAHFDFQAHALQSPSLQDLLKTANGGHSVIIGFPPDRWDGGHVLIVRGGDSQSVYLVDSSRLNMQAMSYDTFLKYWVGFAVVVTPENGGQQ